MGKLGNYKCDGQMSIFDFIPKSIPICEHSGHTCNKVELWKVADTLDELQCPHVCCRKCNTRLCGARCNGAEEPKPKKANPPIHRYLRYGPHTLIPEVREETRQYLEEYGVPDWVTWDPLSVPCQNCTWFDGKVCCSGGHTNHFEFGFLICDGFYQSITERKPSTVGDAFPSMKIDKPRPVKIMGIMDDAYCPECDYCFWETKELDCDRCPKCGIRVDWTPWHQANDEEVEDGNDKKRGDA